MSERLEKESKKRQEHEAALAQQAEGLAKVTAELRATAAHFEAAKEKLANTQATLQASEKAATDKEKHVCSSFFHSFSTRKIKALCSVYSFIQVTS